MEEKNLKIDNLQTLKQVLIQRREMCQSVNRLLKDETWLKNNLSILKYTLSNYPEICENPSVWQERISEFRYRYAVLVENCNELIVLLNFLKQKNKFYLDYAVENVIKRFSFEDSYSIFVDYRRLAQKDEMNFIDLIADIDNPFSKKHPVDLLISYNHFLVKYPALFSPLIPKMDRHIILADKKARVETFESMVFARQKIKKLGKNLSIYYQQLSDYARIYH